MCGRSTREGRLRVNSEPVLGPKNAGSVWISGRGGKEGKVTCAAHTSELLKTTLCSRTCGRASRAPDVSELKATQFKDREG